MEAIYDVVYRQPSVIYWKKTPKNVKIKHYISPLLVDRFGYSLQFCNLDIEKEAITDIINRRPPVITRQNRQ